MALTLRQVRYFVAAAETGKLSQAAVQCCVSQSAITLALKGLEDDIGVRLLDRHPSGVTLTKEGYRFLQKCHHIMASVADSTVGISEQADAPRGRLVVGVTYTVIGYFLGQHLVRFGRRYPNIVLNIRQMDRGALEKGILRGEIDLAVMLVSNLRNKRKIAVRTLKRSQRRLWLPPGHSLFARSVVKLADVAQEPYVLLTADEAGETTSRYWAKARLKPKVVLETTSVEAVRSLIGAGLGVSILSDMVYRPWSLEGDRIEARQLDEPVPSMDVGIAYRAGVELSTPAQEFIRFMDSVSTPLS